MKFKVSEKFKRKGKRKAIFATILVVVFIFGFISMLIYSNNLSNKVIAVIGAILLTRYLPSAYRNIKSNDTSYPEIEVLDSESKIEISYNNVIVSMPLSDIEKLTIQKTSGKTTSILLTTKTFSNLRFEGYEKLEQMADILKKHTPQDKLKIATWFHR